MSPTLKNALLLLLILVVAGLIGFALYWMFLRSAPSLLHPTKPTTTTQPGGTLPNAGQRQTGTPSGVTGGQNLPSAGVTTPATPPSPSYYNPQSVTQVTSDYAVYPSVSDYGVRYHNAADGKFYQLTPDGQVKQLSDQTFYNVSNVTWAKKQNEAVIEYPDNSKIVYNFDTKKQVTLPKHWNNFSFNSDGTQIVAKSMGLSPENRWLITTNSDGTNTKLIEPMGNNADKVQVSWSPSNQVAAFSRTGQALGMDRQEVLLVGLNHENFKSLTVEGLGFLPEWSPTGQKLLYSIYSGRSDLKPELWITDAYGDNIGNNRQMINLNTWADKCAFGDDNTVFCAVPRELPQGAGMSREIAAGTPDDLYKIDLRTGLKTPIALGADDYSVKNINYDSKNNKVIFTDVNKNGIFEANL